MAEGCGGGGPGLGDCVTMFTLYSIHSFYAHLSTWKHAGVKDMSDRQHGIWKGL